MRDSVLARKLLSLDTPDCGCRVHFVRLCVRLHGPQGCRPKCVTAKQPNGCEDRRRDGSCACDKGKCDCPPSLLQPNPCPHILESWRRMLGEPWAREIVMRRGMAECMAEVSDEFARRLWTTEPHIEDGNGYKDVYREPAMKPRAEAALEHQEWVSIREDRFMRQLQLWHPCDLHSEEVDDVGVELDTHRNGAVYQRGLKVFDPSSPEPDPTPYPEEVWDGASLRRLVEVQPLAEWPVDMLERLRRSTDAKQLMGWTIYTMNRLLAGVCKSEDAADVLLRERLKAELKRRQPKEKERTA